jgi:hypothetical protein
MKIRAAPGHSDKGHARRCLCAKERTREPIPASGAMLCDGLANSPDFLNFPAFLVFCGSVKGLKLTVFSAFDLKI